MTHARTTLRDALVTACTGRTSTGARVFVGRMYDQDAADLPCLLIAMADEPAEASDLVMGIERNASFTITGFAKGTGDVDAALNTIAEEVETAVGAASGISIGDRTFYPLLTGTRPDFNASTDQPVGVIELTFRITYFTAAGVPGAFQ